MTRTIFAVSFAFAVMSSNIASAQCPQWQSGFHYPSVDGEIYASLAFESGDSTLLIAAGTIRQASGVAARNIIAWDGQRWQPLGDGISGTIYALASHAGQLYAAGNFITAGPGSARNVVRWDGAAWSPVGGEFDGPVFALLSDGDALIAGGAFAIAGNTKAANVASWRGDDWEPIGPGLSGPVYALESFGGLAAGGRFGDGDTDWNIATWNGTTWSPLGSGADAPVYALRATTIGGTPQLLAGGDFMLVGGIAANRIAAWSGVAWSSLGDGFDGRVRTIASLAGNGGEPTIRAGGSFSQSGTTPIDFVAQWTGTAWESLGGGIDGAIYTLAQTSDAGFFAGGIALDGVQRLDGTAWSPVGTGGASNGTIFASIRFDNDLRALTAVGGHFSTIGGVRANNIAFWDGTSFEPLGSGVDGAVFALAAFDGGSGPELFAAGDFAAAGGNPASRIARWNPESQSWSPVADGLDNTVSALHSFDPGSGAELWAGGYFRNAGSVPAQFLARWDGVAWTSPAGLPASPILALASFDSGTGPELYTAADPVYALAQFDDGTGPALYAGGDFQTIGGVDADRIARWDGTNWAEVAGGMSGTLGYLAGVHSLAVHHDGRSAALYAGGDFTIASGNSARRVARYDGVDWRPLGDGAEDLVHALATSEIDDAPALLVGGIARSSPDSFAPGLAAWAGEPLFADFDGTGSVGLSDLTRLLASFDTPAGATYARGDLDDDGDVDLADLMLLLSSFGVSCE